ncbi:MAG: hypothetical protein IJ191_08480 [Treponema sp.]|nr:hypothetical protein [Treponema sp.]
MNIIIPMAGAGKRFSDEGYKISKPAIPTIDRKSGKELPMVICAVSDLPGVDKDGSNVIFIDRTFHKTNGVEDAIKRHFPAASFITVEKLTEGQACTCLLAKDKINNNKELLIAGCDNGMVFDEAKFEEEKQKADCLVFTYRHNEAVLKKPNAYGWMRVDSENNIIGTSIKKALSENPLEDHAVVATFWFKHGSDFVSAAEKMIAENDRINDEFYVDQVVKYILDFGLKARVFEIERYICWGTPKDYEEYQATIKYWAHFVADKRFLGA